MLIRRNLTSVVLISLMVAVVYEALTDDPQGACLAYQLTIKDLVRS